MYENVAIITQIWHSTKILFYKDKQCTKSPHSSLKYHNKVPYKHSKLMKKMPQLFNLAWSNILVYMHLQPMVPDHGTKNEKNPSNPHGGICKARWKD